MVRGWFAIFGSLIDSKREWGGRCYRYNYFQQSIDRAYFGVSFSTIDFRKDKEKPFHRYRTSFGRLMI